MKILECNEILNNFTLDQLKQKSTFGALSEESITWLIKNGRCLQLDKGDLLFSPGEPGDSLFVIIKGSMSHYKEYSGYFSFIKNYDQGEQIGFMSMIGLHKRVGKALAYEESILLEIDSDLFYRFHNQLPKEFGILLINLARALARTLRVVDDKIVVQSHRG